MCNQRRQIKRKKRDEIMNCDKRFYMSKTKYITFFMFERMTVHKSYIRNKS